MKLYGSLTSPYVRKVRAFVQETGLTVEFTVEAPTDPAGNVARLNPLGKVPVLVRDNGEVLFDSPMIIEYLDSLAATPLLPQSGEDRWRIQRWHALGQGMADATVARLMETRRVQEKQDPGLIARQEGKIAAAMSFAEDHLRGHYLGGERFGLADIAVAVALEYIDFRYAHDWRTPYPHLAEWHAGVAERPCLKDTRFAK
jgi:glutathione S-transferase